MQLLRFVRSEAPDTRHSEFGSNNDRSNTNAFLQKGSVVQMALFSEGSCCTWRGFVWLWELEWLGPTLWFSSIFTRTSKKQYTNSPSSYFPKTHGSTEHTQQHICRSQCQSRSREKRAFIECLLCARDYASHFNILPFTSSHHISSFHPSIRVRGRRDSRYNNWWWWSTMTVIT